ncbi:MAG: T9SS type A sorting domain-containing protein [Bacteroidetes bacterium]|nr:T9SS type A sorting domain-containing protein [Bacteroidota bacterium]
MKTIKLLPLIFTFLFSLNLKSQTSIINLNITDSTNWDSDCLTAPFISDFTIRGIVSGYDVDVDGGNVQIFFGDGADTSFAVAFDSLWSVWQGFSVLDIQHNYNIPGNYNIMFVLETNDGLKDTIFTTYNIVSGCSTVSGYLYIDANNNCIKDVNEIPVGSINVSIKDSVGNTIANGYTDTNGFYTVSVPENQNVSVSPRVTFPNPSYTVSCPVSGSTSLNLSPNSSNTANFGLQQVPDTTGVLPPVFDLGTFHTPSYVGAPGGTGNISFCVNYNIYDTLTTTVSLTLDNNVSFTGMVSGPAPTSITGNTLTWDVLLVDTTYLQPICFSLNVITSTSAPLFQCALFSIHVSPTWDLNPTNNHHSWCLFIGGPYDPNNKEVYPPQSITPDEELSYLINFQNTGTAPAININLIDTISSYLDMNTFEIVQSSHTVSPILYNNNIFRFEFRNINLPDSNTNEPLSHGWIEYRIKPKVGIPIGTEINNTAHIYFDYNSAIVTNTTINTIEVVGIKDKQVSSDLLIYPNPGNGEFTVSIQNGKSKDYQLSVFSITGKEMFAAKMKGTENEKINLSHLSAGIYFVKVIGDNGNARVTKVIISK